MAVKLIEARLQTATSSGEVYSTISVHKLLDLIVPASKCGLAAASRHLRDSCPSHEVWADFDEDWTPRRAEVLLVALAVAGVFIKHVGRARLDLRVEDGKPELLRGNLLARATLGLVLLVQLLKFFPMTIS